jgi:predicted nucleic acid-binding Zn ribbon protein
VPTDEGSRKKDRGDEPHDGSRDPNTAGTGASGAAPDVGQRGNAAEGETAEAETADTAAASALARAREAARAKGLRPGSKPSRKRNANRSGNSGGSGRDRSGSRDGRDPSLLGDQMDRLMLDRGWNVDVAVGSVMGRWPDIVGTEVATHCTPVTFSDGVLIVRADSTAWATQLRLMSSSILGRLETEVGKDAVTELRVQGPNAPSWTRGPRKSTGPGPRDTYG